MIDWMHFTPWRALAGGAMIGASAGLLALGSGRILGASGLLGGLIVPRNGDVLWRAVTLVALIAAPVLFGFATPIAHTGPQASLPVLIAGGLLVGFGTRLGSGCTSGHGICGLSRLSLRSLVAVLCFMATGFATVAVVRHLLP